MFRFHTTNDLISEISKEIDRSKYAAQIVVDEMDLFFLNDSQKTIAEKVLSDVNERLSGKVVTKVTLLKNYCPAEEYHQKYLEKR